MGDLTPPPPPGSVAHYITTSVFISAKSLRFLINRFGLLWVTILEQTSANCIVRAAIESPMECLLTVPDRHLPTC